MLPLCLPHLRPLTPFLLLKEVLFSQVVFSPPPIPPPLSLSLALLLKMTLSLFLPSGPLQC